jgi:hypothetical protein
MTGTKRWMAIGGVFVLALGGVTWSKGNGGGSRTPPPKPSAPVDTNDCDLSDIHKVPWCKQCNRFVEKEELDNDKHKTCSTATTQASACVKTYYKCPTCGKNSKTLETCPTDKKAFTKKVSMARIVWHCPTCHAKKDAPGNCANATCKNEPLVKSCEFSGTLPHIRTWPEH